MISVTEALNILKEHQRDFGVESIALAQAHKRILKETWTADRDFPPYDRVTMDGIAIQYITYENGKRDFDIEGLAAAGMPLKSLRVKTNCLEVMTGAIMPANVNTVIRYEDVQMKEGIASVMIDTVRDGQNVHIKGKDQKAGDLLLSPGIQIGSPEIGLGASLGKAIIQVARLPKVLVISTGDELVKITATPLAHQIRRSNVYRIVSSLKSFGITAEETHLNDDKDELTIKIKQYLKEYDVILLSGGVSKGKFDFIPEVMESLKVNKLFHRIQQRPGKPFWFGEWESECSVFAFPGNPISSFLCMERYFKPWLMECLNQQESTPEFAILSEDVNFKPNLTYYLQVSLSQNEKAQVMATPRKGNGSGDLVSLSGADAFIELTQGKDLYQSGEKYPIIRYR